MARSGLVPLVWAIVLTFFGTWDAAAQEPSSSNNVDAIELNIRKPPPGVMPPKSLNSHRLTGRDYPIIARRLGMQGGATYQYLIIEDGTVGDIRILESTGTKMLDDVGLGVIRRWRFEPAKQGGKPIKVWITAYLFWSLRH